ncbi:hypothetical protein ABZ863_33560 [Saccharomonospora sp. NPDC046836]|uniref:hypothetical protein n=1 Tax=Saccharomonospora sp. NPDC046836 TaxID=3156921 RepID=UPI0033F18230
MTAIEPGDKAALDQEFGARAEGINPYYIRYTVENVDGTDFSFTSAPSLRATTAERRSTGVVVSGDLGDCEGESAPAEFNTPGATYDTCRLQGGQEGADVAGAMYDEDDYDESPIVWTP